MITESFRSKVEVFCAGEVERFTLMLESLEIVWEGKCALAYPQHCVERDGSRSRGLAA